MRNVFVVTKEQFELSRKIESKLLELPDMSGILFVSAMVAEVSGDLEPGTQPWQLILLVGCGRNLELTAVEALVWAVVDKDPELHVVKDRVKVSVHRGVARSPARSS